MPTHAYTCLHIPTDTTAHISPTLARCTQRSSRVRATRWATRGGSKASWGRCGSSSMGCRELSTEVGVLSCVFWYSMLHVWDWVGGWGRNQDCNLVFFAATFPHRRSLGPGSAESTGVPVAQVACGMQIANFGLPRATCCSPSVLLQGNRHSLRHRLVRSRQHAYGFSVCPCRTCRVWRVVARIFEILKARKMCKR
jgi:hypothetical protein